MSTGAKRFFRILAVLWLLSILWPMWQAFWMRTPDAAQEPTELYVQVGQSAIDKAVYAAARLQAITFAGMAAMAADLMRSRHALRKQAPAGLLPALAASATALMILHITISRFAFAMGLRYDLSNDGSILGIIGTATWLSGTPVLYGTIIVLCIAIGVDRRRDKSSGHEEANGELKNPEQKP